MRGDAWRCVEMRGGARSHRFCLFSLKCLEFQSFSTLKSEEDLRVHVASPQPWKACWRQPRRCARVSWPSACWRCLGCPPPAAPSASAAAACCSSPTSPSQVSLDGRNALSPPPYFLGSRSLKASWTRVFWQRSSSSSASPRPGRRSWPCGGTSSPSTSCSSSAVCTAPCCS